MYCSSCGKQIPDESIFCMYCGKSVAVKAAAVESQPLNGQPPVMISDLEFQFKKEIREAGRNISRQIRVFFKLLDKDNKSTSYDGTLKVVLNLEQKGDTTDYYYNRGRINKEFPIKSSEFFRSPTDKQIWCLFNPEEWWTFSRSMPAVGKVEVWFTPWDKKDKKDRLYRTINIYALVV